MGCVRPESHLRMGWPHETWCQWMVEAITGKGTSKKLVLEFLPESRHSGNAYINERWPGSLFQTLEATDENEDLDLAISVYSSRNRHSLTMKQKDRSDRVGTYRGIRASEIGWLLELENLESYSSNLEIYSVANRKPMHYQRDTGVMCAKTRYISVTTSGCIQVYFEQVM